MSPKLPALLAELRGQGRRGTKPAFGAAVCAALCSIHSGTFMATQLGSTILHQLCERAPAPPSAAPSAQCLIAFRSMTYL